MEAYVPTIRFGHNRSDCLVTRQVGHTKLNCTTTKSLKCDVQCQNYCPNPVSSSPVQVHARLQLQDLTNTASHLHTARSIPAIVLHGTQDYPRLYLHTVYIQKTHSKHAPKIAHIAALSIHMPDLCTGRVNLR